mgnify:CR=1 FL=1
MENQPKKRGRKAGSKNKTNSQTNAKEPPKKRGRKPNKKIVHNENPVFADDNLNIDDLIIKLNGDKKNNETNLSTIINEESNYVNEKKKVCWNCCHSFDNMIVGLPIKYSNNVLSSNVLVL